MRDAVRRDAPMDTPTLYEFIPPTLQVLREGGGSLTNGEMVEAVARILHLPDAVMERRHTRYPLVRDFDYCLAWAQAFLKQSGHLTRSVQGVWVLTPKGKTIDTREVLADFDTEGMPGEDPLAAVEGTR